MFTANSKDSEERPTLKSGSPVYDSLFLKLIGKQTAVALYFVCCFICMRVMSIVNNKGFICFEVTDISSQSALFFLEIWIEVVKILNYILYP